jgi:hypothetical protein
MSERRKIEERLFRNEIVGRGGHQCAGTGRGRTRWDSHNGGSRSIPPTSTPSSSALVPKTKLRGLVWRLGDFQRGVADATASGRDAPGGASGRREYMLWGRGEPSGGQSTICDVSTISYDRQSEVRYRMRRRQSRTMRTTNDSASP